MLLAEAIISWGAWNQRNNLYKLRYLIYLHLIGKLLLGLVFEAAEVKLPSTTIVQKWGDDGLLLDLLKQLLVLIEAISSISHHIDDLLKLLVKTQKVVGATCSGQEELTQLWALVLNVQNVRETV